MSTIAITMIGHNEAELVSRALKSAEWADQLVYVDCDSSDNSLEVARTFTSNVHSRPNLQNLNVNKSFAVEQATADWVFYLDPDETIPQQLACEIRSKISAPASYVAFTLPRRNYYYGTWLKHGGQYPDIQLRLFKKDKARFPCVDVHETLATDGPVGHLNNALIHETAKTPADALRKMDFYATFHAEAMVNSGQRPSPRLAANYMLVKPAARFFSRYVLKAGFLDGWEGFIQACIGSIDFQIRFMKFWGLSARGSAPGGADKAPSQ